MSKIRLQKSKYKGKLIVFEGIDGSGKTTLINNLIEFLKQNNKECVYVKMPSDRVRGLKVFDEYDNSKDNTTRNTINLINLTIMVSGDRLIQLDEQIIPNLKQGKIVVCDRYCFTGYVRCPDKIIKKISSRFIKPNLSILCDCEVKTAKNRVLNRNNEKNNYYDEEDVKKQKKRFLELAKHNNFVIINTDKKIEQSYDDLLNQIKKVLNI